MTTPCKKQCGSCGKRKPVTSFPRHCQHSDGLGSECKPCAAAKSRDWYRQCQERTGGLYSVFVAMKQRCHNPRHDNYCNYGARGIRICDAWRWNFQAFLAWATSHGFQRGLQIDRIDNDKGYSPDNCRFVTPSENARNKRSPPVPQRNGRTARRNSRRSSSLACSAR